MDKKYKELLEFLICNDFGELNKKIQEQLENWKKEESDKEDA